MVLKGESMMPYGAGGSYAAVGRVLKVWCCGRVYGSVILRREVGPEHDASLGEELLGGVVEGKGSVVVVRMRGKKRHIAELCPWGKNP